MKVILVGYSKTGTKTLASAFTILGYNNYDYLENYYYLYREWIKVFEGKATSADIRKMMEGVDALTDAPVFYYWKEICEAFPEAKIVLTVRDEDEWYRSFHNQVGVFNKFRWSNLLFFPYPALIRMRFTNHLVAFFARFEGWPFIKLVMHHEKLLRAHYRQHNQDILEKIPKERLLVYKVSDGWGPLCKFLEVDIPNRPFPHKNQRGNVVEEWKSTNIYRNIILQCLASTVAVSLLAGYTGYLFYKSKPGKTVFTALGQCTSGVVQNIFGK